MGRSGPRHGDRPLRCSVCGRPSGNGLKVLHFGLIHAVVTEGRRTSRGAGAINLCDRCWREAIAAAAINRRQVKAKFA